MLIIHDSDVISFTNGVVYTVLSLFIGIVLPSWVCHPNKQTFSFGVSESAVQPDGLLTPGRGKLKPRQFLQGCVLQQK